MHRLVTGVCETMKRFPLGSSPASLFYACNTAANSHPDIDNPIKEVQGGHPFWSFQTNESSNAL